MLFWEAEFPELGEVHHLMVLSYHLQHPSLYSPEGLYEATRLLTVFLGQGAPPEMVRKQNRAQVDSSKRKWKITASTNAHGAYCRPVQWSMTAVDVVAGGAENYCVNVNRWAQSIYLTVKEAGVSNRDDAR